MKVPVFVKVNKEIDIRPSSDDINLTDLWKTVEVPQEIRELVFELLIYKNIYLKELQNVALTYVLFFVNLFLIII